MFENSFLKFVLSMEKFYLQAHVPGNIKIKFISNTTLIYKRINKMYPTSLVLCFFRLNFTKFHSNDNLIYIINIG